uniref:F-box and leucine rich repeat protein 12 n=1 Tax=Suricata suricatta TaxID=37032 RepID=A0A673TWX5_SURSU
MATLADLPDSVLLEIFSYLPGLSPLEGAGGRPVALATRRPDSVHDAT